MEYLFEYQLLDSWNEFQLEYESVGCEIREARLIWYGLYSLAKRAIADWKLNTSGRHFNSVNYLEKIRHGLPLIRKMNWLSYGKLRGRLMAWRVRVPHDYQVHFNSRQNLGKLSKYRFFNKRSWIFSEFSKKMLRFKTGELTDFQRNQLI